MEAYLQDQLIAYIGNKRRLQPFLGKIFEGLFPDTANKLFLDPFAGSGAVARVAKYSGFDVHANDWEPYAYLLNDTYIRLQKSSLPGMFEEFGGLDGCLTMLNFQGAYAASGEFTVERPFFSRHYAPVSTADYNSDRERLFFTHENALFLDAIREEIYQLYISDKISVDEEHLLLAALLYECATHANTSGVFKAYYKKFGSYGEYALSRILSPMELQAPILMEGRGNYHTSCENGIEFVKKYSADICYLDPPYNIHQYGSNYHILNSLTLWDHPDIDSSYNAAGTLKEKSGIRKDWVKTWSPFCSQLQAEAAMRALLDAVDAQHIVMSYSTDGIIPFDLLVDILSSRGEIAIHCEDYTSYRGGRQSLDRATHTLEFVIHVDTAIPKNRQSNEAVSKFFLIKDIMACLRKSFLAEVVQELFHSRAESCRETGSTEPELLTGQVYLPLLVRNSSDESSSTSAISSLPCLLLSGVLVLDAPGLADFQSLTIEELKSILKVLQEVTCSDHMDEVEELFAALRRSSSLKKGDRSRLERALLKSLRKFAFVQYKEEFLPMLLRINAWLDVQPEKSYLQLKKGLKELKHVIEGRFQK